MSNELARLVSRKVTKAVIKYHLHEDEGWQWNVFRQESD
jgi:hypothetical protein